jgi:tetratricopeptide (TPR) repeat protein
VICPTDEALAALSAGELAAEEREQIEDHAATCAACRGLVSAIAGVRARAPGTGIGAEGATIDRYRILGAAGHGAMGVVLRAHDPVLDREVAIKMVNSAAESSTARLLAEAQTLARVDHPNVVRVYDAGVVGEEVFIAMAFVEGPTLAQWSGSVAECRRVLTTVGAGIAAVHAVGLVHRDIKPDNIIVSNGVGVLVDLGLAKVLVGGVGSGRAGTEHFIAPEIRAGTGASPASDQYAWCRVVEETLREGLTKPQRAAIDRVLARGLSADPKARFATLGEAIDAVDVALAPPRRRWPLFAGGGVIAAVIAGYALHHAPVVDACARDVPMQWTISRPVILATAGEPVTTELDARATRYATLATATCRAEPANHTTALREQLCLEETWNDSARIFPGLVDPKTVRHAIDELTFVLPIDRCASGVVPAVPAPPTAAQFAESEALQDAVRVINFERRTPPQKQVAELHALEPRITTLAYPRVTEAYRMALATAQHKAGNEVEAKRELDATVALAESAGDDDTRTRALIDILRDAFNEGSSDTTALAKAAEAAAARLGNPAITAELEMSEGLAFMTRGDNAAALKAMTEAMRLLDEIAIGANAEAVNAAQNLAGVQQASGDMAGAQATYDRGYALSRARYGDDDVNTLEMRGARATNLLYRHDAAARPELAAVAAQLKKLVGDAPPVAQALGYVCESDLQRTDYAASKASCDAALAAAEKSFGPKHPQIAWPLTLLGQQRIEAGAPAEAVAPLERALVLTAHDAVSPTDHAVAQAWLALAVKTSQPARAKQLARDARAGLSGTPSAAELVAKLAAL